MNQRKLVDDVLDSFAKAAEADMQVGSLLSVVRGLVSVESATLIDDVRELLMDVQIEARIAILNLRDEAYVKKETLEDAEASDATKAVAFHILRLRQRFGTKFDLDAAGESLRLLDESASDMLKALAAH